MEESKKKLDKLVIDAKKYFQGIKDYSKSDLNKITNIDMMNTIGMCRILMKTYIAINDIINQFPEFQTEDINNFLSEFKIYNAKVDQNFNKRIGDIDSPSLDEILNEYKRSIKFLENWVNQVYEPTVDLFTNMNPNNISDNTIQITFDQISKYWHHKDILMGLCSDLKIYKSKLNSLDIKINYLYRIVHTAKITKA